MAVLGAQPQRKKTATVSRNNGYSDAAQDAGGVIKKRCCLKGSYLC
jgi:hypothetical protein